APAPIHDRRVQGNAITWAALWPAERASSPPPVPSVLPRDLDPIDSNLLQSNPGPDDSSYQEDPTSHPPPPAKHGGGLEFHPLPGRPGRANPPRLAGPPCQARRRRLCG